MSKLQVFRRPDLSGVPWVFHYDYEVSGGKREIQIPYPAKGCETAFEFISRVDMAEVEQHMSAACARDGYTVPRGAYQDVFMHTPETDAWAFDIPVYKQIGQHLRRLGRLFFVDWWAREGAA